MATDHFADDPRTQLERMLAGDLYIADDPQIAERQRQAMRLAANYQTSYLDAPERARTLLGKLLGSMGEDVEVRPPLYVDYGSN
ncbi:maltose acetyltransferase domain-containing protein, partial [Streptomyces hydrogenans]